MRIALVAPWGRWVRCGIRTYSEELASALARQGADVWVVPHVRFGRPTPEYAEWLADRTLSVGAPVVHVQHEYGVWGGLTNLGPFKDFVSRLKGFGAKIVVTMHSTGVVPPYEAEVLNIVDRVVVHNEFMRSKLGAGDKVSVIPHGASAARCDPAEARERLGLPKDKVIVLHFGFIDFRKGTDIAIRAFREANPEDAVLLIAGGWHVEHETPYIRSVRDMARGDGRIIMRGWVEDDEVDLYFSAADVVLQPSRSVSDSGVVQKALAHGKPTVVLDHPAFRNRPVIAASVQKLPGVLRDLMEDVGMRSTLSRKALEYAEEVSWDNVAKRHVSLYGSLIGAVI